MDKSSPVNPRLAMVQELFHGLIRSRARAGGIAVPRRLPQIANDQGSEGQPTWFPVDGMYGGFAFWLTWSEEQPTLHSRSWCRVVDGSGQYHVITPLEIRLIEQGFV